MPRCHDECPGASKAFVLSNDQPHHLRRLLGPPKTALLTGSVISFIL